MGNMSHYYSIIRIASGGFRVFALTGVVPAQTPTSLFRLLCLFYCGSDHSYCNLTISQSESSFEAPCANSTQYTLSLPLSVSFSLSLSLCPSQPVCLSLMALPFSHSLSLCLTLSLLPNVFFIHPPPHPQKMRAHLLHLAGSRQSQIATRFFGNFVRLVLVPEALKLWPC